ncbi:SusC/RagA family TonB-linked outer membrane protein [Tenacibaculum aquimarinum]|uniref:SusC/RagA family TonB-linked outer membrane protein n=1 Tax=Tenacibaculum aquimarinum TaxID=2910675 RepID=UPI001F0AE2CC|nr:TonB-dependent receptor [Tenacibaculum aquimarinum]MCH3885311.1 TonB-dependent receptor [Tenacibaculum aquimarinum]
MSLKFKITLLVAMFVNICIFAQSSYSLKGTVVAKSDNFGLPGVSVRILNSNSGTETDLDGSFSLQVKKGNVLEFSFLGFASQTVTISNQKTLNISLVEDADVLDEVVIVGYGTQKKSHLTGAISKVKNETLDQIAVSRVDDALVGQVSGVNIQATEGEAGSAPTIRIRGVGSITGNSGPLVVVDGVVVDSDFLGSLDMNDVESFEVLKDAASGAIYGSRGGNGVVMITTKQGKEGKTKYSYNTYTGIKTARQSDAYYSSVTENAKQELNYTYGLTDKTKYKLLLGDQTNWQDVIFDGGVITNHSFAVRGGNEKIKFSTSLNYLHDEGVLLTDDYKKYNFNGKVEAKLGKKFTVGARLNPSFTERRRFDGSTHDILRQPSWLPVYLTEETIKYVNRTRDGGKYADAKVGDYAIQRMFDDFDLNTGLPVPNGGSGTDISNTSNTNPAAKILERDRRDFKLKLFGSVYGKYKITDDLKFRTAVSGDYQRTRQSRYQGVLSNRNGASASRLDSTYQTSYHLVLDNILTYDKTFGKHEVGAVLGTSAEKTRLDWETIQGSVFADDSMQYISAAASVTNESDYSFEKTLLSFFTRVNYAYDDRYLASASFRRDGSSVFGPNKKYGNFYAVSAGWNVHNEDFLQDNDWLNRLKFRISYGVTGNDDFRTGNRVVDHYPYLAILDTSNSTGVSDGTQVPVANPLNIANPDLQWEEQVEFNPGVDFGLFNSVVTGSVDYYKRTSNQLLLFEPVPSTTGFSNALLNRGEVENSGWEFEIRTRNVSNENFKWSTTAIASLNENTLNDFGDADGQIQSVDSKRAAEWINLVGSPISSFYGWVVERDIPREFLSNPFHPIGAEAQDVYVKDLNGDGIIDDDDKTILGNPYPDFVWSLSNEFKIGNFDASFMFQGSHGAEVRNMGDQYILNHFNSGQDYISTTPNQEFIKEKIFTNDIIQDASYIALRNVNIGYTFNRDLLDKIKLSNLRVYATGQNLMYLTASDYTGFNPESINTTSATTYGYQRAGSPVFSTVSLGLNVEF